MLLKYQDIAKLYMYHKFFVTYRRTDRRTDKAFPTLSLVLNHTAFDCVEIFPAQGNLHESMKY